MASSLAETIETNFLNCAICFEPYRDPRALPCQHGFCRECLEQCVESSRDKRTLTCPNCRKVVKVSKAGVTDLPVHFLVSSLKDTVDMEKKGKIPSCDTSCSNCNSPGKKAKVRCLDCKEYLCDTCYANHKTFKAMKTHRVVTMEDILSGKVSLSAETEDECKEHGQPYRYYCETEKKSVCQDCVILKECRTEHDRVAVAKAAKKRTDDLDNLITKCNSTLKKYKEAVKATENVKKELEIHSKLAKESLAKVELEYIGQVKKTLKRFEAEIDQIKMERVNELDKKKTSLETTAMEIHKATEDTARVTRSSSKYGVISSHATMSRQLQELSQSQPVAADKALGYVKFEAATLVIPTLGKLSRGKDRTPGERWKLTGQFSTGEFSELHGLCINKDGSIVLTSANKGVKVFSREGTVRYTLYDSPGDLDVDVTPDNNYVTIPRGKYQIQTNDSQSNLLFTTVITDVSNCKSHANSIAVDIKGRIIVGQVENTISIHNADGSLISRFATQNRPYRLAVTSNGEIVSSFRDSENKSRKDVQLMDYSGCNVRIIQPPAEVETWVPAFVCCRQGEIFVVNEGGSNPSGVYRYTAEGDYLGCVTTEVISPSGIALSQDGMELFVAQITDDNLVKIFQRP